MYGPAAAAARQDFEELGQAGHEEKSRTCLYKWRWLAARSAPVVGDLEERANMADLEALPASAFQAEEGSVDWRRI